MPGGDGTGPFGQGSGTGKGMGRGGGRMGGNRPGAGPTGYCICPKCKARITHQRGIPCYSLKCSKCGIQMIRG